MYLDLAFPPGVYKNGTERQAKGRFDDSDLVRGYDDTIRPIGGWVCKGSGTVTGIARAITIWRDNSATVWGAIGTHSKLYAMSRTGTLSDITPAGFTAGRADATLAGGYGIGTYGTGTYGTPRPDSSSVLDVSMWTLGTFGEKLVGCMADDGKIYQWSLVTATPAAQISGSPTARAVHVTADKILMALGSTGDARRVDWSDQGDYTVWTASDTNQAGSQALQSNGRLMCGKSVPGAELLFTNIDVWRATYNGPPTPYTFEHIGSDCGVISQGCVVTADSLTFWMGANGFWAYNGYVQPLNCDVGDYVFTNLNKTQVSKVVGWHNSQFGEAWWFYPSASATEIDRYVAYNYRKNTWWVGSLSRTAMCDKGSMLYPVGVASTGYVYDHETGYSYDSLTPYIEGGPLDLSDGNMMRVREFVPDEKTAGDVTVSFYTKDWPNGTLTTYGPYTASNPIDLRFEAKQVKVRYTGATASDWRVGVPRLELVEAGWR